MKIPSLSVVVNTCALGPRAAQTVSATQGASYAARRFALGNFILMALTHDPYIFEVIVVGEWTPGEGYTYVPCASRYFSSDDAVAQRQAAFEASRGEFILFMHDDHILHPRAAREIVTGAMDGVDVMVLPRFARGINGDIAKPNGGDATPPYLSGHAAVYRREILERVPWSAVPAIREWDQAQTMLMRGAGARLSWPKDGARVYDVELGAIGR